MYPIVLSLHNLLRWVVLAAAIVAVLRALAGWLGRKPWTPASAGAGRLYTIVLDVQFLVGILLYGVLSPITRAAFANMGAAMGQRDIRFFVAEHAVTMILALAFAHMGKALAPKAPTDAGKWRRATLWYAASLLLILGGMPWWRPLLRFGA
jgi:hypothetical protein